MEGVNVYSKLLIKPLDFEPSFKDWKVIGTLNPAAVRMNDDRVTLYIRVAEQAVAKEKGKMVCPIIISEDLLKMKYHHVKKDEIVKKGEKGEVYLKSGICRLPHISHFRRAIIDNDGEYIEYLDHRPAFTGMPGESEFGVEDPRITKIGSNYFMTYVGVSEKQGVSTYLSFSKDCEKWKRLGLIFREQNKDVVLFPEKIKGRYVALNRPETMFSFSKPGIWISYSKDLMYWGGDKSLLKPRTKTWENDRIGGGAPPIKTKDGWLAVYHGVKEYRDKRTYSAGAVLLDLKNPEKIIARSPEDKPLISPKEEYDKQGYISNVVFPSGAVKSLDEKSLLIYCGGADSVTTLKKIKMKDIFDNMEFK
ncbi:glycosidase [Candidatus Woesearchaeota archaeon]|nr:glycosidase [Candidatus Woesearchaeota archaeon]